MFDVFTVSLVRGSPETALSAPYSLVLTEEAARKYLQRRKEISVRKVLAASTSGIVVMLSTWFARLVIVGTG